MVTLKEIAQAVGVSTATVSRVLNFDSTLSVTAKKRQAIIEAAERLNYATPRNRNRANQQGLSKVALVHFLRPDQELIDPYYVALRLGIESRCAALKIETVKVYHTDSMPDANLLQSASGVIAIGRQQELEIAWLKRHARHLVFADFAPDDDDADSVQGDLGAAMRKLLGALVDMGYRHIAYLGGNDARGATYVNWMREADLFDEYLVRDDSGTEEGGYRAARALLGEGRKIDALVLFNDNMAVGAYRAIHELGLSIPDDIAVASFNDISVAQFMNPPLSTVHLPAEEIGETAVELLLERAGGRELAKHITLASRLIWRGSTRHPEAT
ncbi:MAG: LacI family DNA-binding transcriptional regulator [Devosia sp.]|uniref:LacI family DNA-binding transcriptional regulator n=1 Tax=Devosia sp. TaxID=1871048 RepID=UPI001A3A637A|nr:LacI family DNA-binding transcriptional regulator [Devosia sp.]MBL8599213.1 LacI family DNA-binding transcriptional regulator [Devosia sp.]